MSVSTVRAALITLLSSVTGVKRVYAHAPVSLPASELPAVILLTGAATHAPAAMGRGTIKEDRTYTAVLCVAPAQGGVSGEAETACDPYFALVRDAVFNAPTLSGLAGVPSCRLTGDNGITQVTVGGAAYLAIEFTIVVTERVSAGV